MSSAALTCEPYGAGSLGAYRHTPHHQPMPDTHIQVSRKKKKRCVLRISTLTLNPLGARGRQMRVDITDSVLPVPVELAANCIVEAHPRLPAERTLGVRRI